MEDHEGFLYYSRDGAANCFWAARQDDHISHAAIEETEVPIVQTQPAPIGSWSVLELLTLLALRRRFIAFVVLGCAGLTAVIVMLLPVRYSAATSILPPQQSMAGAGLLAQMGGGEALSALAGSSLGVKNQLDVYVAMFRSRTVEDAMIRRFDLQNAYRTKRFSDTRKIFEERSAAVGGIKDGLIRVTVEGPTPEAAATMANAYVVEFEKLAAGVATTEAAQRRLFFDRQLEEAKNNLSYAEQDLKRTELTTGMVQPENQSRAMIESAAAIQGQIAAKQVQLRGMATFATDSNPDVVVLKREIDALHGQLTQLTGNSASESDLFVPKGRVPEAALDYVRKLREVKYRETIFQALATQYQLAKLDEAKQGAVFQVIDIAVPPDKHSFPQRSILVILSTLLSSIAACFLVWGRAAFEGMQRDPNDGPRLAGLLFALRTKQP